MDKAREIQYEREREKIQKVTDWALKSVPAWAHPYFKVETKMGDPRAFVYLPECEIIGIGRELGHWNTWKPFFYVIRYMLSDFSHYVPDRFEKFEDAVAQAGIWWEEDKLYREVKEEKERRNKGKL